MGYGLSYANNATAITVGQCAITVWALTPKVLTYGDTLGTLTYNITSGSSMAATLSPAR